MSHFMSVVEKQWCDLYAGKMFVKYNLKYIMFMTFISCYILVIFFWMCYCCCFTTTTLLMYFYMFHIKKIMQNAVAMLQSLTSLSLF